MFITLVSWAAMKFSSFDVKQITLQIRKDFSKVLMSFRFQSLYISIQFVNNDISI